MGQVEIAESRGIMGHRRHARPLGTCRLEAIRRQDVSFRWGQLAHGKRLFVEDCVSGRLGW